MPRWTPHDLRKTCTTGLSREKFATKPVVAVILSHSSQGVTDRHYDHYDLLPEKREALIRWGEHVQELIEGKIDP